MKVQRMPLDSAEGIPDADIIFVGGGLANGLIAWRLALLQPKLRILLLESGQTLGGNHTWCFHEDDVSANQKKWLAPFIVHQWSHYSVYFPGKSRRLESGYFAVTSERFHSVVQAALGTRARTQTPVQTVAPRRVHLQNGQVLTAHAVIDGRGVQASPFVSLGYQKFLGQELRLNAPHGLNGPILMDACVPQQGGYRFVYVLPLAVDTVLVEDTFFADDSQHDLHLLRRNIAAYVRQQGWTVMATVREELGVLPLTLAGNPQAFWDAADGLVKSGLSAGLFNPATGYSLPNAVKLADCLSTLPAGQLRTECLFDVVRTHALKEWNEQGFFRLLNRMLFFAAAPQERWRVLEKFYGLPLPLIKRFYAARLHLFDKMQILSGKPPVAMGAAMRAAFITPQALARRATL